MSNFRKSHVTLLLLIFTVYGSPAPTFAYRPMITEDAGVGGNGIIQTEWSCDYIRWHTGDYEYYPDLVTTYGVSDDLDIAVEIPYMIHRFSTLDKNEYGVSDIILSAKYLFYQSRNKHYSLATKAAIKLNNGNADKGIGNGAMEYSLLVAGTSVFKNIQFHGMAGYTWIQSKPEWCGYISYGIASDLRIKNLHLFTELTGFRHSDRESHDVTTVASGGGYFPLLRSVTIDCAIRKGIGGGDPAINFTTGFTWTLD